MDRETRDGLKIGLLIGALVAVVMLTLLTGCAPAPRPVVVPPPPLAPSCSLTVHVFAGDPAADVKVSGARVQVADQVAETDGAGNAILGPFAPGSYIATATAEGYLEGRVEGIPLCAQTSVDISLTRAVPPRPRQVRGRLQARGRALIYPDGARFRWRGVTAFALLEQVAHGREAEAVAFLSWAQDRGFNLVRVLAMASGMFRLSPADGRSVLPRLLELAADHDLYVEVVALADTRAYAMDRAALLDQVRAVATIAAGHEVALVQVSNEFYHATQVDALHDEATLDWLAGAVPAGVLYTLSPAADDEAATPQGLYVTRHLDRGRDTWNMVRRVRELENVSAGTGKPVINDEPIGAAETLQPGKRLTDPSIFYALGLLGRIFEVGSTFHCEDCLYARVPGPVQQRCAAAFVEGATLIPDTVALTFSNATWSGSPVTRARFVETYGQTGVVRAYSGLSGARGWTVLVGLTGDPGVVWGSGWQPVGILADRPGIRVLTIKRK